MEKNHIKNSTNDFEGYLRVAPTSAGADTLGYFLLDPEELSGRNTYVAGMLAKNK